MGNMTTATAELPFAGYVRVSRKGDREDLKSPELQRRSIQHKAELAGLQVQFFEDDINESGADPFRKTLRTIIAKIKAGELAGIVVDKLDRLSRLTPKERVLLFEDIENSGGVVLSASENIDATTPEGRFQREVFLAVARLEWERFRDGWATAQANALEEGRTITRAPFGYLKVNGRFVVDTQTGAIVRALFEMRARGVGWGSLGEFLEQQGVKTANGNERWSIWPIKYIIKNRVYLGELKHGEFINLKSHQPIVDEDLWLAANREMDKPLSPRRSEAPFLLVGILRCQACRYCMQGANNRDSRYYRCSQSGCPNRWKIHNAKLVERVVTNPVFTNDPGGFWDDGKTQPNQVDTAALELDYRKAKELFSQVNTEEFQEAYGNGYLAVVAERRKNRDAAAKKLADARYLNSQRETFDESWSVRETRDALGRVLDYISISRDKELVIYPKGIGVDEIPRRGKPKSSPSRTRVPFGTPPKGTKIIQL